MQDTAGFQYPSCWSDDVIKAERTYFEHEERRNNFYKSDINNDGKTDLIVVHNGNTLIVLSGSNKYVPIYMEQGYSHAYFFQEVIQLPDHMSAIIFRNNTRHQGPGNTFSTELDTLVCKFNGLIEYHQYPQKLKIQKITFQIGYGWPGRHTLLEINYDGRTLYNEPERDPRDSIKLRFGVTGRAELDSLWKLLNYLAVKQLNDHYNFVDETDQETGMLNFYFEDGTVKKVSDYAFSGTFGLRILYAQLFAIQNSTNMQSWLAAPPAVDSYLVDCPIAFRKERYINQPLIRQLPTRGSDTSGQTFVYTEWLYDSTLPLKTYINLFPDHRFVFTDPQNHISLGYWMNVVDSVIVLDWNGLLTLKTIRDKSEYKKYMDEDIVPHPVKIENWRFIYKKGSSALQPIAPSLIEERMFSEFQE